MTQITTTIGLKHFFERKHAPGDFWGASSCLRLVEIAEQHKKLAFQLVSANARTLSVRLQRADSELAMLEEYCNA